MKAILLFLFVGSCNAAGLGVCTVIAVHDGDTATVNCTGRTKPMVLRIANIDAPELHAFTWGDQPWGPQAAAAAKAFCPVGSPAKVTLEQFDNRTSRWIAKLGCPGDLGEYQAAHGFAWPYLYMKNAKEPKLAAQAKVSHLGLWADPSPIAPTIWRAKSMHQGAPK